MSTYLPYDIKRNGWLARGLFAGYYHVALETERMDPRVWEAFSAYMEALDPRQSRGLMLVGSPGVGKTLMAHIVMGKVLHLSKETWPVRANAISAQGYMELVQREMTLVDVIRKGSDPMASEDWRDTYDRLEKIRGAYYQQDNQQDWLLLDDLSTEYSTDWSRHQVTSLIRNRGNAGKPTLITTNLGEVEFARAYGERTASFIHQVAEVIFVEGEDVRRARR